MDQVIADTDIDVNKMKEDIESMWTTCSSKRERRGLASQNVPGFTMIGDNVGELILQLFTSVKIPGLVAAVNMSASRKYHCNPNN